MDDWDSIFESRVKKEVERKEYSDAYKYMTDKHGPNVGGIVVTLHPHAFFDRTLFYLPIFLITYDYEGTTYDVLMNGMTGEIIGNRPYAVIEKIAEVGYQSFSWLKSWIA